MSSNDLQGYKIQGIFYLNKRTHRIQQNIGGACPLLALSNTLFLNHQIHYNKGGRRIKFQELTDCLTQHLENMLNTDNKTAKVKTELRVDKNININNNNFDISNKLYEDSHDDSDDIDISIDIDDDIVHDSHDDSPRQPTHTEPEADTQPIIANPTDDIKDKENISLNNNNNNINNCSSDEEKKMDLKIKQIEECVSLFPKLEEGLDINIKFSDACDFEENPGYRMFSHYGFKLFHGWCVNPNDENTIELYKLIGHKSYDETIDYLISDPDKNSSEDEKKELECHKEIIRKFFRESATQLTSYGLERLYTLMEEQGEDILAIFFRNNHFSTIVKHGDILYEFVTDEGIVDADPQITWQTLSQISGDEEFVNNKFQAIHTNISQYTQIAQYNRMKNMADNGEDEKGEDIDDHDIVLDCGAGCDDELINILDNALNFIDSKQFEKLINEDEFENIDPLISHGLTQRINDTFDIYMCRDYMYGINNMTDINNKKVIIRMFRLSDALSIYNLYETEYKDDEKSIYYKNIDWMHNDNKYAIVLELLDNNENNDILSINNNILMEEDDNNKIIEKDINEIGVTKIKMNKNIIIGCIIYEWMKFNFWDWRETDWEDYDIENVYNVNNMSNNKYNKQKLLRESGVRTDYFIHIENLCINNKYNIENEHLNYILLQSLLYAYPSGSKFGVLIPTINTQQVKCFTNSKFTITRLEQSYGTDTKYKMTTQSIFTLDKYQSWIYNSNIIFTKVKTITGKTNTGPAAIHTVNTVDTIIQTQNTNSPLIDNDYSNIPPLIDENNMHVTGTGTGNNIEISDDDTRVEHYEEDESDNNNGLHDDDDDDDNNIHRIHCDSNGIDSQQQSLISGQEQLSGQAIDNNIMMSGGISGMSGIGGVSSLFGYHSGHQSINNNNIGGDNYVFTVLNQLDLMQYNSIFIEFNINKDALLHLDPSVVEFMISDENDRNNFLQWLKKYKLQRMKNKPTKPPQQQSQQSNTNTNVKTHKTNTNTNTDTDQLK